MKKIYLSIIPLLILTACSTDKPKVKRPPKREIQPKVYGCSDIDSIINNHNFDVKLLTNLYKKCPNNKTKVALLIAKGDKYSKERKRKLAYQNYQEARVVIRKNRLKIFDEYDYYLSNRVAEYDFQSSACVPEETISKKIIDAKELEGYIRAKDGHGRGAKFEEFARFRGIPLKFSTGSFAIEEGVNLAQAREIGKLLSKKDYRDRIIYITGFTDTRGSSQSNQELSLQRANGLKSYLINNFGLKEENIRADGYGESFPICSSGEKQKSDSGEYSCSGEENYSKSRRVTLEYGK